MSARKSVDHRAEAVWYDRRDNLICRVCRKPVTGDGTARNPWRHLGEKPEQGTVG